MDNNIVNNINNTSDGEKRSIRKTLIIVLIVFVVLGVVIFLLSSSIGAISSHPADKEHLKYNTNKEFLEDKKIEDLVFSDVKCSFDGESSTISYAIVNNSDKVIHLDEYEIVIKDKDGKVLATINPNYDYDLNAKERFETSNSVSVDLTMIVKWE